jgi:hypothetical protein
MTTQLSLFPEMESNSNKYTSIDDTYFGFKLFEEILAAINERNSVTEDNMFRAGVGSAEAAVRRIREEYYHAILISANGGL